MKVPELYLIKLVRLVLYVGILTVSGRAQVRTKVLLAAFGEEAWKFALESPSDLCYSKFP